MARTPRTQVELHADSRTLLYEFDMLCGTAGQLAGLDRIRQKIAYNSTIESFALHCRALIAFFFDHKPRYDSDVVAADFFSISDHWASSHSLNQFLAEAQTQAHKQIAHITTDRRNLNASGGKDGIWQISGIVQAICKMMADFLATAPDHNLDPDAKQKLVELIRQYSPKALPSSATPGSPQQAVLNQVHSTVHSTTITLSGKTCP